mgnify:CR=1 FL=1|tara:strand:+ start:27758 stop:29176 length:1419 start_codon:yes stop_codon:yes gene_type:complete
MRLLHDLTFAKMGFSGIPQETRLLFNMFAGIPELIADGLLMEEGGALIPYSERFVRSIPSDLTSATCYMNDLINEAGPKNRWTRLHQLLSLWTRRRFSVSQLPTKLFKELIWRNYFAKSLSAEKFSTIMEQAFYATALTTRSLHDFAKLRKKVRLNAQHWDFVLLQDQNQPRPLMVPASCQLLIRYYDAIPLINPDFTNHGTCEAHQLSLAVNSDDAFYVCISDSARKELLSFKPELEERSATVLGILPQGYQHQNNKERLEKFISARMSKKTLSESERNTVKKNISMGDMKYIASVSTLDIRKNYVNLIKAWEIFCAKYNLKVKLIIVAGVGGNGEEIVDLMKPHLLKGDIIHLENLSTDELQLLYSHAEAMVFPSFAEGFGYTPLEAMQCECPTIISDLPVFREIMGEASLYCDPYDVNSIAERIAELIVVATAKQNRQTLIKKGLQQVKRYQEDRISADWLNLFKQLKK